MQKVRFGIVGVGGMGTVHARYLLTGKVRHAELTAVCDIDPNRLKPFAALPTFAHSADLIRSGLLDAVLIATPHYDHTTIGIDALQQGLHVLTEKPISVHKADGERLLAAHTNCRQVFGAMFNQRTDPYYQKIRQLVQSGELGAVQRIQWTITDWYRTEAYYATGGWRATWRGEGGGVLLNQATHNLDLFQWMFGMPTQVRAICRFGRYHDIEVEDDVTALLEYANGATATFITSTGETPGTNRLEVAADRGRLVYENNRLEFIRNAVPAGEFSRTSTESYAQPRRTRQEFTFPNHGGQHVAILQNFTDAILDGAPLLAPAAEGIGAVELANAMLWSSLTGRVVDLPLDSAGFAAQLAQLIAAARPVQATGAKNIAEARPYLIEVQTN